MIKLPVDRSKWIAVALASTLMAPGIAIANDDHDDDDQRSRTVDCYRNHASVQAAIDGVRHGRDATIYITGFCDERVIIVRDGITLSGNEDGSGGIGGGLTEITVTGAQRVLIENLELTGAGSGVSAREGASVMVRNSHIHDNDGDGVAVFFNAFGRLESNLIEGNGQAADEEAGIQVFQGGTVRSSGNTIAGNGYAAVEVGAVSYYRSFGDDILRQQGCDEETEPGAGAFCGTGGTVAIDCYRSATCELRGSRVTGNSEITALSNFEARNSSINGIVFGNGGSRVHFRNTVSGSYSLFCSPPVIAQGFVQCGQSFPP